MKTYLIDFLEQLTEEDLDAFLKIKSFYDDPDVLINEVCRYGSAALLQKLLSPTEVVNEPYYLYNALLSCNLEKVKILFNPNLFDSKLCTKAVMKSSQEIYGFLMEQNVILDFTELKRE